MKLTQDERWERYEQRLQWKKEGSSYEIEFAYGLLDSSERPLGRVPARTGMAAPWHKHVAVLLAESCILMNIVMSIISPVDKDHVANKPFSHRFLVYFRSTPRPVRVEKYIATCQGLKKKHQKIIDFWVTKMDPQFRFWWFYLFIARAKPATQIWASQHKEHDFSTHISTPQPFSLS